MKTYAIVKIILALCGDSKDCIAFTTLNNPKSPQMAAKLAAKWRLCVGRGDGSYETCAGKLK